MPSLPDRAAVLLILVSGMATVLGILSPDGTGMIPLLAGLTLLLLGALRREPLAGGFLLLLMFTLRIHVMGDERYFPREISLSDYLLVLITVAACFRAAPGFWRFFQSVFAPGITALGLAAWVSRALAGDAMPFSAGILTPPQTGLLFGVGFCLSLGQLAGRLSRGDREGRDRPVLLLWLLLALVNGGLVLLSDGPRSLLLAGLALLLVKLAGRGRRQGARSGSAAAKPHPAAAAALLVLLGTMATLLPGGSTPAAVAAAGEGLGRRLALLQCFLAAPLASPPRFFYGLGFTNSSTWLCREVSPASSGIQADNLLAQVAADNGVLTMLAVVTVLFLLLRQGWRWSGQPPDPVVLASFTAGLYTLLVLQFDAGWARNTFLQALVGLQLGALTLRSRR